MEKMESNSSCNLRLSKTVPFQLDKNLKYIIVYFPESMEKNNVLFKSLKFSAKFIFANFIACVVSSLVMFLYTGVHSFQVSSNGETTWRHESDLCYYRAEEGLFFGRFDKNGYNNTQVPEQIDVLLLGSSHFEAIHIMQKQNFGSLLNEKFTKDGREWNVYNLGISSSFFPYLISHYSRTLQIYQPRKYVVLEYLPDRMLDPVSLEKAIDGSLNNEDVKRQSPSTVARIFVKFRILEQILIHNRFQNARQKVTSPVNDMDEKRFYDDLRQCFHILAKNSYDNDVQCLLLFRPDLTLDSDGTLRSRSTEVFRNRSKELAEAEGLVFIDMTDRLISEYYTKHILPYGFWNTLPDVGHCNKEGHRMMAESIYDTIMELENSKEEETK